MFAHGGGGGISFECLSLGVPVMQHAHRTYFELMYRSMPPFLNCRTEDEIFEKLVWCCETDRLGEVGEAGRAWVEQFVSPEHALTGFLFYYGLLTGDHRLERAPHLQEIAEHNRAVAERRYDPFAGLVA